METSLREEEGGETVEFDVVEGHCVYVKRADGADAFLDWDELPADLENAFRKDAKNLKAAHAGCLATVDAALEFYARAEKRDRRGSATVSA